MTRENVFDGLKEILANVKPKLDSSTIGFGSSLAGDLGIDSLSMLLLSLAAETRFHMQFASDAPQFKTVGEVCDYIVEHTQD